MAIPLTRVPTLAQRWMELRSLALGEVRRIFYRDKLICDFTMGPPGGRMYRCRLTVHRDGTRPTLVVLAPNLIELAQGRALPHIYRNEGPGTRLCLWLPGAGEWTVNSRLRETVIPWALEWLSYFEDWLVTDKWLGGGMHLDEYTEWERECGVF